MADHSHITVRKRGFLSSAALGLSAIVITIAISCTVVTIYTLHIASDKSERIITVVQSAIRGLPELQKNLPPVLADMLNDRRQPDYAKNLKISAHLTSRPGHDGIVQTAIEVVNNGPEVVSLLSIRVIVLDQQDHILQESIQWAATPFSADNDCKGPIMPGSRRYFICPCGTLHDVSPLTELKAEVEITELRLWNRPDHSIPIEIPLEKSDQPTASAADWR